jgi:hypothetical protein
VRRRSTLARVAGCAYISPSIAGATTTGAAEASVVAVTVSLASPFAIAPSQCAVAGATRIASAESATTMWPMRPSGSRAMTSCSTGWRVRASSASGATKRAAAGVRSATTSASSAWSARTSSGAL